MNEKEYVPFKVAKLLKENGFDWQTDFVWYEHLPLSIDWRNKTNQQAMDYFYFNETTEHHSYYRNCDKKPSYINGDIYSAPTVQSARDWIEYKYGFFIEIGRSIDLNGNYHYDYMVFNKTCKCVCSPTTDFITYYEAANEALEYVLENLIKRE